VACYVELCRMYQESLKYQYNISCTPHLSFTLIIQQYNPHHLLPCHLRMITSQRSHSWHRSLMARSLNVMMNSPRRQDIPHWCPPWSQLHHGAGRPGAHDWQIYLPCTWELLFRSDLQSNDYKQRKHCKIMDHMNNVMHMVYGVPTLM
jgi:hypothetical protein